MKKWILSLLAGLTLMACSDTPSTAPVKNACETPVSKSADVTVTAPNCGGTYKVGDTIHVKWTINPTGGFSTAKLQMIYPNGANVYLYPSGSIGTTDPRFGNFGFTVPDSVFDQTSLKKIPSLCSACRVVVTDYQNDRLTDTSDVAFAIIGR